MTKPTNAAPQTQPDDDDRPIWLHQEGFPRAHPWRLGDYGDAGILTEEEIALLITKHGLSEPVARDLSVWLGNCLSNDEDVAINLAKVTPSITIERGVAEFGKIFASVRLLGQRLAQLDDRLSQLSPALGQSPEISTLLPALQAQVAALKKTWEEQQFDDAFNEILNTRGAVAELSPDNKRKLVDTRRMLVVESCCYAWLEAGKKVGVTTITVGPDSGKRTGPLIELIQDVARMTGDPEKPLSAETLKEDIDCFKALYAKRTENDQGLGEPTFGTGPVEDVT
ncbi:hypothetical protein [Salipiger bermudensis]|uniref:Uncharacterized protein n=1 Tax=Salipiger bermudensis (strain DSM 26914 / JCM 13377 / KCTC 12554 / HTCC2601) TaxID=314265 RepID=Q0FUM8_SALBH|nr:hypothetical protein [Salipiger bermudensis]EAU48053.1 hypothetical protein R2601_01400 [Salipiger bermudensis HTCC2601]